MGIKGFFALSQEQMASHLRCQQPLLTFLRVFYSPAFLLTIYDVSSCSNGHSFSHLVFHYPVVHFLMVMVEVCTICQCTVNLRLTKFYFLHFKSNDLFTICFTCINNFKNFNDKVNESKHKASLILFLLIVIL